MKASSLKKIPSLCALACLLPTAWAISTPDKDRNRCGDLMNLRIANVTISEAVDVPAGTPVPVGNGFGPPVPVKSLPTHCLVRGEVNHHKGADNKDYGDQFEIRMPMNWEGRFLFMGGGGLDGVVKEAIALQTPITKSESRSALSMGYAVVSTDGGHHDANPNKAPDGSFGSDPEARLDYDYRSTKIVTDVARKIIVQFYGNPIKYSYFQGCSNGGREGLTTAQHYPDYFDGIVAGAPAFNLTHAAIAEAWNTDQLASIAPRKADDTPDIAKALTLEDLKLLVHSVLAKCDALDGLKDDLIFSPEACHFDPKVLACSASQVSDCLSTEKVKVIDAIFKGPVDSKGKPLYVHWPYDSGDSAPEWRVWMTGIGAMPSINVSIFPSFFNGLALAGVPPSIDIFNFNFDTDPGRINKAASEINATSRDWTAFQKRNAKLLLYTGMSDPVFSALDLIRYYKQIEENNGGDENVRKFARLFLVPGMTHCGGGPSLDEFDTLGAIQAWVEEGKAPDSMTASGHHFPGRTRPLCAYPLIAKYNGEGNTEDAASFSCKLP